MKQILLVMLASLACSLQAYPYYWSYSSDDLEYLRYLSSEQCMSKEQLEDWDRIAAKQIQDAGLGYHEALRVYTYLYQAQADAAYLSYSMRRAFCGSLDPTSSQVLALFFSDMTPKKGDLYSEMLANIVVERVKKRLQREKSSPAKYTYPADAGDYGYGEDMAKWIPWHIRGASRYWPAMPPLMSDAFWECQCSQIRYAQTPMTEVKLASAKYWAGMTFQGAGDWIHLTNEYLFRCPICFAKCVDVRATLATGLYDASIVCFSAKYHYCVQRPQVTEPSIQYMIDCPKHPSYPSGHSTEGAAAATILSYYFPSERCVWEEWAEQSGWSRIWAGIHYPIDHKAGKEVGRCVASQVLHQVSRR